MLCVVEMPLKGVVGGCSLNSHGNYVVDYEKHRKIMELYFLNFRRKPETDVWKKNTAHRFYFMSWNIYWYFRSSNVQNINAYDRLRSMERVSSTRRPDIQRTSEGKDRRGKSFLLASLGGGKRT